MSRGKHYPAQHPPTHPPAHPQLLCCHKRDSQRAALRHQPVVQRSVGGLGVADGDVVAAGAGSGARTGMAGGWVATVVRLSACMRSFVWCGQQLAAGGSSMACTPLLSAAVSSAASSPKVVQVPGSYQPIATVVARARHHQHPWVRAAGGVVEGMGCKGEVAK